MDQSDSEKLIIELNYRNKIIDERNREEPFSSEKMFDLLPATVLDKRTLRMVEIHDLFRAVNRCRTMVGAARLFHSLMNPSQSIELIHAKQDAYCELESNTRLQEAVHDFLETFARGETVLFKLLNAHMIPLWPYKDFRGAMATIRAMVEGAANLPQPDTVYLDSLFKTIRGFAASPVNDLVAGPVFRTFRGVVSRKEKGWLAPGLRFRPGRLSGGIPLKRVFSGF